MAVLEKRTLGKRDINKLNVYMYIFTPNQFTPQKLVITGYEHFQCS